MPTTSLYRNCNTTCAEFSKTIFADFLEMDHCFGSAGWIVHCMNLEDFVALLPYFRKCGNIARKTAFCLATGILKIMGSSLKLLGGGGRGVSIDCSREIYSKFSFVLEFNESAI